MIEGQDKLQAGLAIARQDYENRLTAFVRGLATEIAAGARCRVYRNRKSENPSSPLAESIETVKQQNGYDVMASLSYAPYVEFGTSRMAAKPFLTPAAEEVKVRFQLSPESYGGGQ
ncbi:hypothetical protein [Emcibacter nanhaiensis]|uniref:HK97 gp10 family phage protein n=1 Tax=Emcibacter nanhaiensis TaxID=1505037 RepID=A0A501PCQ3_9PROT|nr:hypothetical protein [Emcibacter nanhaiensis]TPD57746.1 hypothetical protein FIV46_16725 [Emcibacter nanhaiensis]